MFDWFPWAWGVKSVKLIILINLIQEMLLQLQQLLMGSQYFLERFPVSLQSSFPQEKV